VPAELLTGQDYAGFFGKLPATGDFVTRGLPDAFRRSWDGWVTAHVAPRQRDGRAWPQGGLRLRIASGGRAAGGVILPSRDSAGRDFPLSLLRVGTDLPDPAALDPWCSEAARLDVAALAPDDLWSALEALPVPEGGWPGAPALVLWTAGTPGLECDAADPGAVLDVLLPP
jgi:type VI secretion system protein ImpM